MTDVSIGSPGTVYQVYANVQEADEYLMAKFSSEAWFALTTDQKGQLLVSATRLFDRQCWIGEPTGLSGQTLAWPRKNVPNVDEFIVPDGIIDGTIEMAFAVLEGSDAVNSNVPGAQKLQSLSAGSVNLTWFRGAEGILAETSRFPLPVQELVGQWLCSSQDVVPGFVGTGSGGVSVTEDDLGYNEGV